MKIICIYSVEWKVKLGRPLSSLCAIPFGLSVIITVLKRAGHEVSLIVLTPNDHIESSIREHFKGRMPKMLCMTAVSSQYEIIRKAASAAKAFDKGIFTVLGGHHASLAPDEVMKEESFDAVCIGEGEKSVLELASQVKDGLHPRSIPNLWIRDNETGSIEKNPTADFNQNLDGLPFIDRKIWEPWIEEISNEATVLVGRGCPNRCTYCCNHKVRRLARGKYVRFRSPENVIGEIERICEEYRGMERIYLEV